MFNGPVFNNETIQSNARAVNGGGISESLDEANALYSRLTGASFELVPSSFKGGTLYSGAPGANGDLSWTRGGDAFRTNASGLIQRVPWNLLQYSEDFTNAVWGKTNVTVTANTTTAPNGTLTADTLTTTATTGRHLLLYGDHSATTITASIYVKKNTHNFIQIFTGWAGVAYANYDINNGIVGDVGSGTVASITNVGNGWYRCSFTSPAASASTIRWNLVTSSTAVYNESWTANGTESVFIWGAQLVEGTTAQTYLPTTDRLNFPRLSYMYGSCPSALLEPQRTNLALYSEQFDNASWTKGNTTVTANSTTAPDGTNTADTLTDNSTSSTHNLDIGGLVGVYTFSVYAKKGTSNYVGLYSSSALQGVYWNLDTGAFSANINVAPTSSSITSVGNGWYRCSISVTTTSTATFRVLMSNNGSSFIYAGTGQTIYLWGAQLEAGAYPTTYIPTTTSATATRVADSFSRNNIYTNGLISASGGTWFVELRNNVAYTRDASINSLFVADTNVGSTNGFVFRNQGSANSRLFLAKRVAGAETTIYQTTTDTAKIAIKWNGTTCDVFANGTKVTSASSFTTTLMEFLIGNGNDVPKFIQQMALFNYPLSDSDCQLLTT